MGLIQPANSESLKAKLDVHGVLKVGPNGRAVVPAGDPSAVNTIENPRHSSPKLEPLTNASASFSRSFPPHSVTLLRVPANWRTDW